MKKLMLIIFFSIVSSGIVFAETVNQRLEKIEQRLDNLEEGQDGASLLKNLMGDNDVMESDQEPPKTKIEFKLNLLSCSKDSLSMDIINVGYEITNNYDKEIKLIDAFFVAKDLFGDEVFKAKIGKGIYLSPGNSKTTEGTVDGLFVSEKCEKIRQSKLLDLISYLHVSKIAFGDNSIEEFK